RGHARIGDVAVDRAPRHAGEPQDHLRREPQGHLTRIPDEGRAHRRRLRTAELAGARVLRSRDGLASQMDQPSAHALSRQLLPRRVGATAWSTAKRISGTAQRYASGAEGPRTKIDDAEPKASGLTP